MDSIIVNDFVIVILVGRVPRSVESRESHGAFFFSSLSSIDLF